jgi:TonB-linked SusC/RagA family outer membrane protein
VFADQFLYLNMLMKSGLPIFFFMALCLLNSAIGTSQSFSISVKNAPLVKVFAQVETQSDFRFFYRSELLKKARKVSLQLENVSLQDVLEQCFAGQPLSYEIIEKIVVVKERPVQLPAAPSVKEVLPAGLTMVKGRIIMDGGEPVEGATVTVKGTDDATSSNPNGDFSIGVRDLNASLIITSIGIEQKEVPLENKTQLTVVVNSRINMLDQVQIIGYGQTTRRFNTGNVTTIKAEEIEQQPVAHILAALEGRVPGMVILQTTGLTGGSFQALIRGQGSIAAGNNPLFIVDGVPYPDGVFGMNNSAKRGVSGLGLLNLNEVERVEVLKDADATAIYGSRGANGVVLITTKKGKPGKTSINLSMYNGHGKLTSRPKLLNLQQYLQMRHETIRNDGGQVTPFDYDINGTWDTTRYTDWSKDLLGGTATITDVKLSIAGGTGTLNYSINGGYHRETTVMPISGSNQRYGVHFNLAKEAASKKYKFDLTASYQAGIDNLTPLDFTSIIRLLKPNQPPSFLPDGRINYNAGFFNPYLFFDRQYEMKQNNLTSCLKGWWTPAKGLELRASLGYNTQALNDFSGNPKAPFPGSFSSAHYATNSNHTLILEPEAFYRLNLKRRSELSILLGATYQKSASSFQNLYASGFSNDALIRDPAAAALLQMTAFRYTNYKYLGTFSRLSYNLDNKYLVNLTGRIDGITRFGPGKQYHPFGAVAVAWILSEEKFIRRLKWIHFAKLRSSYGTTGNSEIRDYAFADTYAPYLAPYQGIQGLTPNQLFDRNLGWELKKSLELALELQLFRGRMAISASVFRNRNSQQLLRTSVSTVTGFFDITTNRSAEVQNQGLEAVFYAELLAGSGFTWNINANASFQKSKLLNFEGLESSGYEANLSVGNPVPIVKAFKFGGVDPQTGSYFFIDRNGKPTTTPKEEDKTEMINIAPRSFGGISNNFSYKAWSLYVTCVYMVKQQIDVTRRDMNFIESIARWQKPGDITTIAKYSVKPSSIASINNIIFSTAGFSDASYIRVRSVLLSYRFKQGVLKIAHLQNLRIYLMGENLFTFSSVKQFDPENINQLSMAPLRVLAGGFQITF